MKKLELFYPTDKYHCFQRFGECHPLVCAKYKEFGLNGHNGEDLYAATGDYVRAAHDGEVVYAGEDGSSGLLVVIRTNEKFEYGTGGAYFKTVYGHLKTGSFRVKATDQVKVGDIIALANNTGFSTGSHLHFGLKPVKQGERAWVWDNAAQNNGFRGAVDPAPYWTKFHAKDAITVKQQYIAFIALLQRMLETLKGKRG